MCEPNTTRYTLSVFPTIAELFSTFRATRVIGIDIPIGLSDTAPRRADIEARRFLGRRGSSVFPAPCRAALAGSDYHDASERSFASSGKRLSKQAYNILPKIRDVDALLLQHGASAAPFVEVHPEVSFVLMNGGNPLLRGKKSADGQAERLALLGAPMQHAYHTARTTWRRADVAIDDLLDAFAVLWSVERIARGEAISFPADGGDTDRLGVSMCIRA